MLDSDRIVSSANERSLLKNLGTWLGLLTFAKNRPLLQRQLDVKATIVLAYQKGRMMAVLPFVQKLLEPCRESRVFRPTNPYLGALLSLLAEVHRMPRLRLNIAFTVEMLFKHFELDLVRPLR